MMTLENITRSVKKTVTAVGTVGLLYGMMEAHYQLPRNIDALYTGGSATSSAMFRTEEVTGKALQYQKEVFGKR
ncbi:MAG: hypothetical protein Q7K45_00395 [Nanoarchaeota archaeon]|nr:hypothetical protein [Nanoarchaeota archaeon]